MSHPSRGQCLIINQVGIGDPLGSCAQRAADNYRELAKLWGFQDDSIRTVSTLSYIGVLAEVDNTLKRKITDQDDMVLVCIMGHGATGDTIQTTNTHPPAQRFIDPKQEILRRLNSMQVPQLLGRPKVIRASRY